MSRKIQDKRFLRLIHNWLKAGFLENWFSSQTLEEALPKKQSHGICSMVANIFLHELDEHLEKLSFNEGNKKFVYIRYANHFLVGVYGSKKDAMTIRDEIGLFLKNFLQYKKTPLLEIPEEKTKEIKIVHAEEGTTFLGYFLHKSCSLRGNNKTSLTKKGRLCKESVGNILLEIPKEKLQEFCKRNSWGNFALCKATQNDSLINWEDAEIIGQYNAQLQAFVDFYSMVESKLGNGNFHKLFYLARQSCLKTLAAKHRTSVNVIASKTHCIGREIGVWMKTPQGQECVILLKLGRLKRSKSTNNQD